MPDETLKEISNTFCVLPWTHMATFTNGTPLLCCVAQPPEAYTNLNLNEQSIQEIWNSNYWKQARKSMLKGQKLQPCLHCNKEEEAGIRSHRINENNLWTKKLGKDYIINLVNETKEDGTLDQDVITLDLRLGNTCNLQCVMCRPMDSSKWTADAQKIIDATSGEVRQDWEWKKRDVSNSNFDWVENLDQFIPLLSNIKHIIFAGGEPLYLKVHTEFLKQCVASGEAHHIELRYHTNGTLMPDEVLELWTKFKFVEVMLSIDCYEDKNTWIRYPSNWQDIENTLSILDNAPDNIYGKILCTVQAINIFYITDFAEWLLSKKFKKIGQLDHDGLFHPGTLHFPNYLCSKVLPKHVKKLVTKKIENFANKYPTNKQTKELLNTANFMNSEDWSDKFNSLQQYIKSIDNMRQTNFSQIFKELYVNFR